MSTPISVTITLTAERWEELLKHIEDAANSEPPVPFTGSMPKMEKAAASYRLSAANRALYSLKNVFRDHGFKPTPHL